ncbi:hypothetical protein [Saliphagus sp. LR7]|uniref:hypothetical protein n=1 Tax=Saliphagus sp. LR7 TaxID=2282654 RepID=UPI000DF7D9FB|nr:hypothetical protein [Saliphagus sp. LR7]
MEFPRPNLREIIKLTVTFLLLLALFQYMGIFYENEGTIDWQFLFLTGMIIPIFTYLLTIITANIEYLPDYNTMTHRAK